MSPAARVVAALLAGLAAGIAASESRHPGLLAAASALEPLGTLWVNAIRMTVVPLVVSLLVTGIASGEPGSVGRIGGRSLLLFAAMVAATSLFAALAAPPLLALVPAGPPAALPAGAAAGAAELPPFREWLTGLVPPNPVKAAADGAMLPLVVFTSVFALAASRTAPAQRETLLRFFRAVAEATFVLIRWILALAPAGVFFLVLPLAARMGTGLAGAMGWFVLVVCVLLVAATLAAYPVAALGGRVPLRRFAAACAPAQAVGFGSRSSLASLPAMLDGAARLGLPERVAGVALPVAVSVFKYGSPIARIGGTLFVARLWGIELGGAEVAAIAAALGILSFYSPGIPSGGLFVMAPVYASFGLPVEGIGLLIALDMLPDMFVTVANVTGDMTVAALLGRGADAGDPAAADGTR